MRKPFYSFSVIFMIELEVRSSIWSISEGWLWSEGNMVKACLLPQVAARTEDVHSKQNCEFSCHCRLLLWPGTNLQLN